MHFITNWKEAWKFNSVQSAMILSLANALFALVPAFAESIPFWVYAMLMSFGNITIVVLRIMAQPKEEVEN